MASNKKKKSPVVNPLALAVQQGSKAAKELKKQQDQKKAKRSVKAASSPVSQAVKTAVDTAKTATKAAKAKKETNSQEKSKVKTSIRTNYLAKQNKFAHPDPLTLAKANIASGVTGKDLVNTAKAGGVTPNPQKAQQGRVDSWKQLQRQKKARESVAISQYDKKLPAGSQEIIQRAKLDWEKANKAGDAEGKAAAHAKAERVRAWAGYSGGAEGAEKLSPELTKEDRRTLNRAGQTALQKAKLEWDAANAAGDEEGKATAVKRGEEIRKSRGYQASSPGTEYTDAHGRTVEYTTPEEKEKWKEQTAATWKAAGAGIAGSLLSLRETANKAMNNYQRERWGASIDNIANRESEYAAKLKLTEQGEGNPEWGSVEELRTLLEASQRADQRRRSAWSVDPGLPGQQLMSKSQEYTAQALEGKSGLDKLLTQAGISMIQNAPSMGLALIPGVGPAVGAGLMGAQAAGAKAAELNDRGAEPGEALTRGLISGGIETLTERIPLHNMLKIVRGNGGQNILKNIVKQAGIEATEESAAYVGNLLADKAAQDPNAKWSWEDLANAAAVGAISGLGFGAGGSVVNTALNARRTRSNNPLLDTIRNAQGQDEVVVSENETTTPTQQTDPRAALLERERIYADRVNDFYQRIDRATPEQQADLLAEFAQLQQEERAILAERTRISQEAQEQPQSDSNPIQEDVPAPTQESPVQSDQQAEATPLLLPEQSEIAGSRGYPMRREGAEYKVVEIPQSKVDEITAYIETVDNPTVRKKYKRILKNLFGGQVFTNVNTVANELAYEIGISSKGIGEIIARQPVSAETLAMLEQLNDIVENAKYIASEPTSHPERRGISRTDIFETETNIGGEPGTARLRVNVGQDGNKLYFATNKKTESENPQPRADESRRRGIEESLSDGENIDQFLSNRRLIPEAMADDVFANDSISEVRNGVNQHEVLLSNDESGDTSFLTRTPEGYLGDASPLSGESVPFKTRDRSYPGDTASLEGSLPGTRPEVNNESERHSVGAAPGGFDPYTRATNEYGAIPPGENPARIVDVPRSTNGEDRVRRFARTALEAEITNPETQQRIEQDILDGGFSYHVRKDRDSLNRAFQTIEEKGAEGALRQWMDVAEGRRRAGKDDMVLAQVLYTNAERSGDSNLASQLAAQIAAEGTIAGQNVQALRLLKQATPEGRIFYMRKIVGKINEDLAKKKRLDKLGEATQVQLDENLVQDYLNAENEADQTSALNEIYDNIVSQMPRTAGDVLTAWRYFAMLGNPRTHIRNILGNVVFGSVRNASNELSSVLQRTIKQENRTRAVTSTRATREFAQQDYLEMKEALSGTKYNSDMDEIRKRLQDRALGPLSFLSKGNSAALSAEDNFFKKREYTRSLASYITAKGWDPASLTRPQLQAARTHAMQDALEATFQEANVVASKLSELERMNKVTKVAIGGAFPFKGVPVNIAKQGFRYSPAGLIKSITADAAKVRSGEMGAAQMIDNLSAGLTGTGIAMLGYWLSSLGFVNAGASDDDKERAIETAQGSQSYSLNLGNWSYTIDWAAPSVLPFFMGAEFQKMLEADEADENESTADKKLGKALDALERMFEPMLNMTVLSGVSDALQSAAYSQSNPFTAVGGSITQSFAGQVVPTLLGQVARTVDPIRRSTYVDKDSGIPSSIQRFLQTQQNKIPGLSQKNIPYLNVWGEESTIDNPLIRALQNFVSPGYIANRNHDGLMDELSRLNSLGYDGVLPSLRQKGQSVDLDKDGTPERLTREQWEQWQKSQGKTAKTLLGDLMGSQAYQDMSDDDKAASVKRIIDYSKETGKLDIGGSEDGVDNWVLNARKYAQDYGGGSPQGFFDAYNQRSAISKTDYNKGIQQGLVEDYINALPQSQEAKNYLLDTIKVFQQIPADSGNYNKAKAAGYTDPAEISALLSAKKSADVDENGSYTQAEIADLIKSQTSDPAEQERLWNVYKQSNWKKTWSQVSSGSNGKSSKSKRKTSKKAQNPLPLFVGAGN